MRIVIKVGSSSLSRHEGGLSLPKLATLMDQVACLWEGGHEIVLVTSAAVPTGRDLLHVDGGSLLEKQALAAVGQARLIQMYQKEAAQFGRVVGQILLTREDLEVVDRRNSLKQTMQTLLQLNALPVINENDSVSVEELLYGDNDTLAARVAILMAADLVVLLTDIDGYYEEDPKVHPEANRLRKVSEITDDMIQSAGGAGSVMGTGGMVTKLLAAKIATSAGIPLVICQSEARRVLERVVAGEDEGTRFEVSGRVTR